MIETVVCIANPILKPRTARRRPRWVVKMICNSKAEAQRVEAFLREDRARRKVRAA